MKLLVLGGTQFLGRAAVESALEQGHDVTLFNRGETNPELFPEAEKLRGDRATDAIPDDEWDAVIDTSGYIPGDVRRSADALRDSVERYLYVSSISVYAGFSEGPTEDSERAQLAPKHPDDAMLPTYENYGALKALCEDVVMDAFAEGAVIVRPGLIVGPHDPTGRFTYWPHRIARGGDVLVPGTPDRPVQVVDVRDLAEWIVDACESRLTGVFDGIGPALPIGDLLADAAGGVDAETSFTWVDQTFLTEQGVEPWSGSDSIPLWLPRPEYDGLPAHDATPSLNAGLHIRTLADTTRDTLAWLDANHDAPVTGISLERERQLLDAWHTQKTGRGGG